MGGKLGGVCALVLLVMGFTAAVASAAEFHFETEAPNRFTLKSEATQMIDLAGGTLSCKEASFEGPANFKTTTQLTASGGYKNCTMFGAEASVNMNSCDYSIRANGELELGNTEGVVLCDLKPMSVHVASMGKECNITLEAQTGLKGLTFKNIGSGASREITIEPNVEGLRYSAAGALCKETGVKTNGRYTEGSLLLTAERLNEPKMLGVWWE